MVQNDYVYSSWRGVVGCAAKAVEAEDRIRPPATRKVTNLLFMDRP
jgi:hypothetical protein